MMWSSRLLVTRFCILAFDIPNLAGLTKREITLPLPSSGDPVPIKSSLFLNPNPYQVITAFGAILLILVFESFNYIFPSLLSKRRYFAELH